MNLPAYLFLVLLGTLQSLDSQAAPTPQNCSENEIYLSAHVRKPGCYRKTRLNDDCLDNKQCNATVSHSYCQMDHNLNSHHCMCLDGYFEIADQCRPRFRCSYDGFNDNFEQKDCPQSTQYCTAGRCLCKPNYTYNDKWMCQPDFNEMENNQSTNTVPVMLIKPKWNGHRCPENQLYLRKHVPKPGCYPKLGLNEHCHDNVQCQVADSFCGFLDDFNIHKCICAEGYSPSVDNSTCLPIHVCSIDTFNADYLQADCPLPTEFCTFSRCLCRPSYSRDNTGDCIWSEPGKVDPRKQVDLWSELKSQLAPHTWFNWLLIIAAVVVFSLFSTISLAIFVRRYCSRQRYDQVPQQNAETHQKSSASDNKSNLR